MSEVFSTDLVIGLQPPSNLNLPIFVYGTLMQGQPGFHQLEGYKPTATPTHVKGQLYIRDGLPLLSLDEDKLVNGQLIEFPELLRACAIKAICQFEPTELYTWCVVETQDGLKANTLKGLHLSKGHPEPIGCNRWSLDMDPVFTGALNVVSASAKADASEKFPSSPGESVDWERAFRIQMAYLLLWSVLERLSALAVGPAVNPTKRITLLGKLLPVVEAVKGLAVCERRVFDSRKPSAKPSVLNTAEKPEKAMNYYYAVRSNLSHRGKGAWLDAEVVRLSLNELLRVTTTVLEHYRACR